MTGGRAVDSAKNLSMVLADHRPLQGVKIGHRGGSNPGVRGWQLNAAPQRDRLPALITGGPGIEPEQRPYVLTVASWHEGEAQTA